MAVTVYCALVDEMLEQFTESESFSVLASYFICMKILTKQIIFSLTY